MSNIVNFKGIKKLTEIQHEKLLKNGYYTLADGTVVQEEDGWMYMSKDSLEEKIKSLEDSVATKEYVDQTVGDINTVLENILGV